MQTCKFILIFAMLFSFLGCTKRGELGTASNPIKIFFIPSVDSKILETNSDVLKVYLEANTVYKYDVVIPQSYIAVVEAFGTKRADVAVLNTFSYILAHQKYGAEARLTGLRRGTDTYRSQIIAHTDSKIEKALDLKDKKVAFVDAASATGYLLAMKKFKDLGIKPSETVFAGKHDNVVSMVYNKQVDAGATFYSPSDEEGIHDARRLVRTQYPDIEKKVKIVELSDPIPNDAVTFRKEIPEEIKQTIVDAILKFISTPEGKKSFKKIYDFDGVKVATDADYDVVRKILTELGQDANDLAKK